MTISRARERRSQEGGPAVKRAIAQLSGRRPGYLAALVVLVLIGTALRVYRLSHWPLAGDELFTLRDSISPLGYQKTRPLLYAMNYFLVRPFTALDELGLRLLPALLGILSIPVMYLLGRRLLGPRAGIFAALLVTFSQIHVYHSQEARYWSLVFVLSAVYPFAIYLGIQERRRGYIVLGLGCALLATLAHPSAILLLGGVFLWYVITVWPEQRRVSVGRRGYWVQGVVAVVVLAAAIWLLYPILESWVSTPRLERLRGPALLLSYADSLSATLVLLAILGVWWLWRAGQRSLAVFLVAVAVVPPMLLTGLSLFAAVATSYLWATAPVVYLGAAAFLDRLAGSSLPRNERAVVVGALLGIILAGNVPLLMSHYRDGGRPDFRQAARFLAPRVAAEDRVLSDQSRLLTHYLKKPDIESLSREPEQLAQVYDGLGANGKLWIVALTSSRGGFKSHKLGLGNLSDWVHGHCQLLEQIGVARLDFRQNEVQVYRCPPGSAPTPGPE